jgi:large conductance mechanosensitive channel
MRSFLRELKEFSIKGNAVDLAIGVIIGGAFGKIVTSLVNDIIMPPLAFITGSIDFSDTVITLRAATATVNAIELKSGLFIQTLLDFAIISVAVFMLVKLLNRLRKHTSEEEVKKMPSKEVQLLTEIRDSLKKE